MHDAIYEKQQDLNENFLVKLAEKLRLNSSIRKRYGSTGLANKVDTDFESGIVNGVNGTSSFFVNGNKFSGGAEDLVQLLNEMPSNPSTSSDKI